MMEEPLYQVWLGLFSVQDYERLIVRTLREGLARGEALERTLERLLEQRPPDA